MRFFSSLRSNVASSPWFFNGLLAMPAGLDDLDQLPGVQPVVRVAVVEDAGLLDVDRLGTELAHQGAEGAGPCGEGAGGNGLARLPKSGFQEWLSANTYGRASPDSRDSGAMYAVVR